MKLLISILCLVELAGPSAFAMGEGERVVGWLVNSATFGAALAHIESERMRLEAEFEKKKAQLRLDLENQRAAGVHQAVVEALDDVESRISRARADLNDTRALEGPFNEIFKGLNGLRLKLSENALEIRTLVETLQQEKMLTEGKPPQDVGELVDLCKGFGERGRTSPACEIIKMLSDDPKVDSKLKEVSSAALTKIAQKINADGFTMSRRISRMESQISGLESYRDALKAKLLTLEK